MAEILVDISELINRPARSGIQRLETRLLASWRSDDRLGWVRFDPAREAFVDVSHRLLDLLTFRLFEASVPIEELRTRLSQELAAAPGREAAISDGQVILVPEVFYNIDRCRAYRSLRAGRRIRDTFFVFDFVPWLHPGSLPLTKGFGAGIMPYLDLIGGAHSRVFISQQTCDLFSSRIRRGPPSANDLVVPLGADGLGAEHQVFTSDRRIVSCVGGFDGKKGQDRIFEAFSPLDLDLELHFAGGIPPSPSSCYDELLASSDPRVVIHGDIGDSALSCLLAKSRASIFISENEGFGLPALESLAIGVPLIVSSGLPALQGLPDAGQLRLPRTDARSIAAALEVIADDASAERLWTDLARLALPTWAGFADACMKHLRASLDGRPRGDVEARRSEGASDERRPQA